MGATGAALPEEREEYTIRPDGWEIAPKAAAKHGITNDLALKEGLPLREVLEKFMHAMERLNERNGRVVSHHIECRSGKLDPRQQPSGRRGGNAGIYRPSGASRFDAGIILQELENAGMTEEKKAWSSIATKGFCTMDPCIRDASSPPRRA